MAQNAAPSSALYTRAPVYIYICIILYAYDKNLLRRTKDDRTYERRKKVNIHSIKYPSHKDLLAEEEKKKKNGCRWRTRPLSGTKQVVNLRRAAAAYADEEEEEEEEDRSRRRALKILVDFFSFFFPLFIFSAYYYYYLKIRIMNIRVSCVWCACGGRAPRKTLHASLAALGHPSRNRPDVRPDHTLPHHLIFRVFEGVNFEVCARGQFFFFCSFLPFV